MRYLQTFLTFNEGLFTTNESDDEIALDIIFKLSSINFPVDKKGEEYSIKDVSLDDNPGTYNLTVDMLSILLEYYKNGKLVFKKELICNTSIRYRLLNLIKNKYISNEY